jgi:hypothetical protein|tara:strand:+ start:9643 stop:10134 length:492 start_codon:yes stop_codon:yes gene_type:complete
MLILIKFLLFFSLAFILFQDYRNRQVYTFLFPIFGILGSYLFFLNSKIEYYFFSVCINLGIILIVVLLNYLFAEVVLKMKLLNEAMGLGDIFFFIAFAISFPTVTFINFFVFSILFTFVIHFALSKLLKNKNRYIPLAGYMSLFLMGIYSVSWLGLYDYIYLL